ncbi:MAG: M48 family metallopeptidase [Gammaproteobacteria bacterium]
MVVADVPVSVVRKNIRNVHLRVYPPEGAVRISTPARMETEAIRLFALDKLGWIRRQQEKIREQERETPREYVERESHYVWGRRYSLRLVEGGQKQGVELLVRDLVLYVRPGSDRARREAVVEAWYRSLIRDESPPVIAKWEARLGVESSRLFVRRMKTRWGSCNYRRGYIRLNTELARKPRRCLDYVILHELVHLLEPSHNRRFVSLMERHMSTWRECRDELNRLPVRHDDWPD